MKNERNEKKAPLNKQAGYFKWLILILSGVIILGLIGYSIILFGGRLVVDEEQLILHAKTEVILSDGTVIKEFYEEKRQPIHISTLPAHVKDAFIAIEDRRFYEHAGIDSKAVGRAIWKDITSGSKAQGASTITQQVVKNLFLTNDKSWLRKTKEVMAATYLEKHFSKDEILNLYLNSIYFGEGAYGVEQATQTYFQKSAKELSVDEAALLAGIVNSPANNSPFANSKNAKKRRDVVLNAMEVAEYITVDERVQYERTELKATQAIKPEKPWLDSYVDLVMKEAARVHSLSIEELQKGGYTITVGLDEDLQRMAYEQLQDPLNYEASNEDVQSSFVAIDKDTGNILSAIGGRDYKLGDLNRVTVKRQPGSTMKPLAVYGPALMKEAYEPYSLLVDQPLSYGDYTPTNYDQAYAESVSLYEALIYSKNAPAVWLLNEMGIPYSQSYLEKLDLDISDDGLSLALGGLKDGLTPLQLANSYRVFLNDGSYSDSQAIIQIENQENEIFYEADKKRKSDEVFSAEVSWHMTEMLKETVRSGTATAGDYKFPLAGKTGTTQHPFATGRDKDAWFTGYTPSYSFALWTGFDEATEDNYLLTGSSVPTKISKKIAGDYAKSTESVKKDFKRPSHVAELSRPFPTSEITSITGTYMFGGFNLAKGKLAWTVDQSDDRMVYHVYKATDDVAERIGEVTGETEFIIHNVNIFKSDRYFIVPYNPLTKVEGSRSEAVELEF